jgi:hypothetical protein
VRTVGDFGRSWGCAVRIGVDVAVTGCCGHGDVDDEGLWAMAVLPAATVGCATWRPTMRPPAIWLVEVPVSLEASRAASLLMVAAVGRPTLRDVVDHRG